MKKYPIRKNLSFSILLLGVVLFPTVFVSQARADEVEMKKAAVAAMETWLHAIDDGKYAASWTAAAPSFQAAVTSDQWVAALNGVRKPLGKLNSRLLASTMFQTKAPKPDGTMLEGEFVIAQFDSGFENLKYAVETVTFEQVDGSWKAAGYFIKPRP